MIDMGHRIKETRMAKGWTQRRLAAEMKVSPSAVAQWEKLVTSPTIANRMDLSKLLNIPFLDLLPEINASGSDLPIREKEALVVMQLLLQLPRPVVQAFVMQLSAVVDVQNRTGDPSRDP